MGGWQERRRSATAAAFADRHLPLVWSYVVAMLPEADRAHEVAREVVGGVDPRLLEEDDEAALRRLLLVRSRRAVRDEQQARAAGPGGPADAEPRPLEGVAERAAAPRALVDEFAGLDAADREAVLLADVLGVDVEVAAPVCDSTVERLQARRQAGLERLVERLLDARLSGGAYCRRMRERLFAQAATGAAAADPAAHEGSGEAGAGGALTAHLRDCGDCRTFAEGLDAVLHHAPALVPPVSDALRGEVLEDLGAPPDATADRRARDRVAGMPRRTAMSAAAAVGGGLLGLLLVFLLAGPSAPGDDAEGRLATVAEAHAGTGTSHRFDVAGDLELRLSPGTASPGRAELEEQLARMGGQLGSATEVEVSFRAQGETDGRGALTYELRWRLAGPMTASGVLEVVSVDERTFLRRGGDPQWTMTDGSPGFDLGVVDFPHHLGEVLGALEEVDEAATMATLELAGETVDQLRARTTTGMVVDAWVGADDGWLRRLRWIPAPPADERDGTTHGEVVVRLHEHGRARFVGVPDDWQDLDDLDEGRQPPLVPRREDS